MDNPKIDPGWISSLVKCDICDHIWRAVYYCECIKLECPNCHCMTSFDDLNEDN